LHKRKAGWSGGDKQHSCHGLKFVIARAEGPWQSRRSFDLLGSSGLLRHLLDCHGATRLAFDEWGSLESVGDLNSMEVPIQWRSRFTPQNAKAHFQSHASNHLRVLLALFSISETMFPGCSSTNFEGIMILAIHKQRG
jgi:hypothetical protein